jgi:transposase
MNTTTQTNSESMLTAGIDYHKRYSVAHVLDGRGETMRKGRIEPNSLQAFAAFFSGFEEKQVRCVFEASMNWGYLYDLLHEIEEVADVTMAHPFKTRIIAEAQIKTDKLDARWLAELHRAGLIAKSHASSRDARRRKELLRQRCFFVRQRTAIRNRIHNLLGGQRELRMPQVSDLFGKKGMEALGKLALEKAHHRLMLDQDLAMMGELNVHIKSAEAAIAADFAGNVDYELLLSIPGFGPTLAALAASEIDGIGRFPAGKKLLGYAGLAPTVSSSGGKTHHGRMMRSCNRWLKWAFIEAAWVSIGCDAYFGGIYRTAKARGKKANTAITIVANRMATIVYHMLTQQRKYRPFPTSIENPGCPAH